MVNYRVDAAAASGELMVMVQPVWSFQLPFEPGLSMQLQHAGDRGSPMAVHDHAEPPNLAEHGRCQDNA